MGAAVRPAYPNLDGDTLIRARCGGDAHYAWHVLQTLYPLPSAVSIPVTTTRGMCTYVGTLATFHMVSAGCQAGPLLVSRVKKRVQHVGAFASRLPQLRAQSHTVPSRVPVVIPIRYSSKTAGVDVVKVQ